MRKKYLVLSALLLLGTGLRAQTHDPSPVRFVNTGRMAVAPNNGATALYVPYSVLMADPDPDNSRVAILQQGVSSIGGSFYQESNSNVFSVNNAGWGTSTGTIVFSHDAVSGDRFIRTRDAADMDAFERASRYVAFPHVKIATDDVIHLPGRMGMDAASIAYREGNEEGIVYLHSELDDSGTKVFDASLRISAAGISDPDDRESKDLVAAGSVIVERDISIYRSNTNPLFPYATPFKDTQRAGYFAGNFVRKFIEDDNLAGHVEYVLGNKDSDNNGWIDNDQYLQKADALFEPGKGYLIKPRPKGYGYDLPFDQTDGTAASAYDKGMFVFDGTVYNMTKEAEQLFADDKLFEKQLSGENFNNTVNWIIGNSYTSAISMDKLIEEMTNTGLSISSTIYLYPAGTTTYIPYKIGGSANAIDLSEIPSMTYFMVRLSKNKTQTGSFTVSRDMQTHGALSNNFLRSSKQYSNELVFRISPEDNDNVYDLAMVALREKATGSIAKVNNPQKDAFQLYAGDKMSIAIEAEDTKVVPLGFIPSTEVAGYKLSVSRTESINSEFLFLEDLRTGEWINLFETTEYAFTTDMNDEEERFRVHFEDKYTGIDEISQGRLTVYYHGGEIILKGLVDADIDAPVQVSDIQGRLLLSTTVNNYPEEHIQANLQTGVYLVHIGGARNQTVKFIVKGGLE
ncbi:T9SS type A sorting domain-containing protein [Bacteroidales bacterium OttesenSCG-928-J19]|nr:T9SS type A sorting domain-containing protein [Bacteroidales bacterium OttesenSCG-928-J19]